MFLFLYIFSSSLVCLWLRNILTQFVIRKFNDTLNTSLSSLTLVRTFWNFFLISFNIPTFLVRFVFVFLQFKNSRSRSRKIKCNNFRFRFSFSYGSRYTRLWWIYRWRRLLVDRARTLREARRARRTESQTWSLARLTTAQVKILTVDLTRSHSLTAKARSPLFRFVVNFLYRHVQGVLKKYPPP